MKKIILSLSILLSIEVFALITIEPVEVGNKPGWSGSVEGSFETKSGNTDKQNYKASGRMNFDEGKNFVSWAEISGEFGESNQKKDTEKLYLHLRYIHSTDYLNKKLNFEAFNQIENNEFRNLKRRTLLGGGVRIKIGSDKKEILGKTFLGLGAFSENILYNNNTDKKENNLRLNSFISYNKTIYDRHSLSLGVYYQPKATDFADFTLSNKAELTINIHGNLDLKIKVNYNLDTEPAISVEKRDFSQMTSLVYSF